MSHPPHEPTDSAPQPGESLWQPSRSLGYESSYALRHRTTVIAIIIVAALVIGVYGLSLLLG